jgi:hypothetical protein
MITILTTTLIIVTIFIVLGFVAPGLFSLLRPLAQRLFTFHRTWVKRFLKYAYERLCQHLREQREYARRRTTASSPPHVINQTVHVHGPLPPEPIGGVVVKHEGKERFDVTVERH